MGLFKKKKSKEEEELEDDDEEFEEEESENKRSLKRKPLKKEGIKDLNPENKRKRKEPPKPWGRKERFTILFLLIFTAGVSGFLALSARDYKLPGLPRLKFSLSEFPRFFNEETIVIEGDPGGNSIPKTASLEFEKKTENLSGVYGLYVYELKNNSYYGVNEDEVFQAASLIKLPVMIGMYIEAEKGDIDLDEKHKLEESDVVGGSGSLKNKPVGYKLTYRDMLKLMGKESDNTSFNICRKLLGDDKIRGIIKKIGLKHTNLENNETTPEDIGRVFKELWNGNLINEKDKNELLDFMTNTIYEDHLAAGIPRGIEVAHKYGRETHVVNDAGIILTDKPYVMVILSKGVVEKEADNVFPDLARSVFETEASSN